MVERRCSVLLFLVVATLLALPAAIAQSTATEDPSTSTSGDLQQPILVGATLEIGSKKGTR
jgi:hypothetical protein